MIDGRRRRGATVPRRALLVHLTLAAEAASDSMITIESCCLPLSVGRLFVLHDQVALGGGARRDRVRLLLLLDLALQRGQLSFQFLTIRSNHGDVQPWRRSGAS